MSAIPNLSNISNISKLGSKTGLVPSESFAMNINSGAAVSPADATTYYSGNGVTGATLAANQARVYVPVKCVLKKIYISATIGVTATSEAGTLSILVNGTTSYVISNNFVLNVANINVLNNTTLNIPLNEGDYFCLKFDAPTWVTNPTSLRIMSVIWFDRSPSSASGQYVLQAGCPNIAMVASNTYYIYDDNGGTSSNVARMYVPASGIITSAGVYARAGVVASNEQFTYAIRLNNTTNYDITTTAKLDALSNDYLNDSLNIPVNAGDFISLALIGPAWVTPPTVSHRFSFVITRNG